MIEVCPASVGTPRGEVCRATKTNCASSLKGVRHQEVFVVQPERFEVPVVPIGVMVVGSIGIVTAGANQQDKPVMFVLELICELPDITNHVVKAIPCRTLRKGSNLSWRWHVAAM